MYLTRDAVKKTLGELRELSAPSSEVVMDFWHLPEGSDFMATAHRFSASALSLIGEPVTFPIHPEDAGPFVERLGFRVREIADAPMLQSRYVRDHRRVYPAAYMVHAATTRAAGVEDGSDAAMSVTVRPLRERDLDDADRIFRLAFGTFLGLPDPSRFGGDTDFIRSRWRANPEGVFAAEIDGTLVGSNFATRWGSFAFFGPLTVRPDLWVAAWRGSCSSRRWLSSTAGGRRTAGCSRSRTAGSIMRCTRSRVLSAVSDRGDEQAHCLVNVLRRARDQRRDLDPVDRERDRFSSARVRSPTRSTRPRSHAMKFGRPRGSVSATRSSSAIASTASRCAISARIRGGQRSLLREVRGGTLRRAGRAQLLVAASIAARR